MAMSIYSCKMTCYRDAQFPICRVAKSLASWYGKITKLPYSAHNASQVAFESSFRVFLRRSKGSNPKICFCPIAFRNLNQKCPFLSSYAYGIFTPPYSTLVSHSPYPRQIANTRWCRHLMLLSYPRVGEPLGASWAYGPPLFYMLVYINCSNMLTKVNDGLFQWLWRHSCKIKLQKLP